MNLHMNILVYISQFLFEKYVTVLSKGIIEIPNK